MDNALDNKRQLMNERNKEMNGMEEEAFESLVSSNDKNAEFLRNSYTAFLTNNMDTSFNTEDKAWSDLRNFQIALRTSEGFDLPRPYLDDMMQKFAGGEDTKKKDAMIGGIIFTSMVDEG